MTAGNPVPLESVPLRSGLIGSRDRHDEDPLQRVEDRVEIEVRDFRRHREPQLVAIQHPVLVGLAVHAVDDGELRFQRLLHGGCLRGDELSEVPDRRVGTERGEVAVHHRARFEASTWRPRTRACRIPAARSGRPSRPATPSWR